MRTWTWLALIGAALVVSSGQAQDSPRVLVEKAVQALGGREKLSLPVASHRHIRGSFPADGFGYTGETWSQSKPRQLKITQTSTDPNDPVTRLLVMEGNKGWLSFDGITRDLDDGFLKRMARARHADKVASLLTLLEDEGHTLSALGEVQIKERPALGIKVQSEGQPDIHLYFDRESHLLVKTWQRFQDEGEQRPVVHELYYSEYRTFDSAGTDEKLLQAHKLAVDGPALVRWLQARTPTKEMAGRVDVLIHQLGSHSFRVRTRATAELQKLGPEAAPLLREVLHTAQIDEEIRQRCEQCLAEYVSSPTAGWIAATIRLLAVRRPPGAAQALLDYLPWAVDAAMTREIQAALFEVANASATPEPFLQKAAQDSSDPRQTAARAALKLDGGTYAKQPGRRVFLQGVQMPAHCEMYRDGQKHMVLDTLRVEYVNRFADSVFARPEGR